MPSGRPSDMVPTDWYTAARTIDQNRATNEAFWSSYQTPSAAPTPSCLATFNTVRFQAPERSANHQHAPTPRNPVLMDIDASQKMQPLPFSCYRCGKPWHKAADCPTRFDIRELSIDDLQPYLEDHLAELNVNLHKHGFCDFCLLFQHKIINIAPNLSNTADKINKRIRVVCPKTAN